MILTDLTRKKLTKKTYLNSYKVFKLLLKQKNIIYDSQDIYGETFLHKFYGSQDKPFIKLILQNKKIDINMRDNDLNTPLMKVIRYSDVFYTKSLLDDERIDVNAKNNEGFF